MLPGHRRRRSDQHNDMCSSSTPAAAASASQSFQIANHPPLQQTAPTRTSDDGKPPAVQDDDTINADYPAAASASTNTTTAMSAASYEKQQPLLTFTAPLNDVPRGGHSGTYRPNNNIASTAAVAQAQNPAPTTTILPPTKRPADGSSDALLDDLERWCHRQFGTAFASSSATPATSASASAAAGGGGGRKRRRTASTTTTTTSDMGSGGAGGGNNPCQIPQLPQGQPQPAPALPSAHSLTTSPSSVTTRKALANNRPASTSFTDLLQLLDAHELKEAIATGSVFETDDHLAAQQSATPPGLAPYAADVWGDWSGMGLGGLGGLMGGSGSSSSLLAYDDLLAGMNMEVGEHPHHQVKMPSSIAGSVHGSAPCSSGRSGQNDHPTASTQPQLPPSCAYEMMTSDVALPAETREELRVAYPSSSSFVTPSYPGQMYQPQPQHHQQQRQQLPYQQAQQGMMPTASVDEVTPRSSNVHASSYINSAYPTQYNSASQDYCHHHQRLAAQPSPLAPPPPPPPLQLQAPAASQYRFLESLEFSTQSERLLREWDRSMGLKACHSKTMLRTSKSRKKLLDKVGGNVTAALMYLNPAAVGGGGQYGSRHGSMVGSYPPGAYPGVAHAMGCATASAYATAPKKEGDATGAVTGSKSSSHESFQDQIEKNSQTATMA